MDIGLLVYSPEANLRSRWLPVNEQLIVDAGKARGHRMHVFRSSKCELIYANGTMSVLYMGKKFPQVDVMITRPTMVDNVDMELGINKHFLLMGIPIVNGYMPILRAKNKIRTLQILSHQGISVPRTVVLKRLEYLDAAIKRVGGFPVIIKSPVGSLGKGVVIVETRRSLLSSLDVVWLNPERKNLLIQEYVAEAEGKDVRVLIVGNKVMAAMERQSAEGDFRSNLHSGGSGCPAELSSQEEAIALAAHKALGLDISGVDLLRSKSGPMVMEVNANPGLEGITKHTNTDVAGFWIDFAVKKAGKKPSALEKHSLDAMLDEPYAVV